MLKKLENSKKAKQKALKIKAKSTIWSIILASIAFALILYAMLPNFAFGTGIEIGAQKHAANLADSAKQNSQIFYAYSSSGFSGSGLFSAGSAQLFAFQANKIIFSSLNSADSIKISGDGIAPDVQDTYFSSSYAAADNFAQQAFDLSKVLDAGKQPVIVNSQNGSWSYSAAQGSMALGVAAAAANQKIFVSIFTHQAEQINSFSLSQGQNLPESAIFETSSRVADGMAGQAKVAATLLFVLFAAAILKTQIINVETNRFEVLRC